MFLSKSKLLPDNKLHVPQALVFIFAKTENIADKGENASYQYFSPFPTNFS